MYHLDREIDATDMSALEAVTSVDEEKARLEAEAEKLVELPDDPDAQIRLEDIYERYILCLISTILRFDNCVWHPSVRQFKQESTVQPGIVLQI